MKISIITGVILIFLIGNHCMPVSDVSKPENVMMNSAADDKLEAQMAVQKAARDFRIVNLKDRTFSRGTYEVRFWVEMMSCSLRLISVESKERAFSLSVLKARVAPSGSYVRTAEGFFVAQSQEIPLSNDQSNALYQLLEAGELLKPFTFASDGNSKSPNIDGGRVIVEMKNASDYSLAVYSIDTKSVDGQKVVKTWSALESLIGIETYSCS